MTQKRVKWKGPRHEPGESAIEGIIKEETAFTEYVREALYYVHEVEPKECARLARANERLTDTLAALEAMGE